MGQLGSKSFTSDPVVVPLPSHDDQVEGLLGKEICIHQNLRRFKMELYFQTNPSLPQKASAQPRASAIAASGKLRRLFASNLRRAWLHIFIWHWALSLLQGHCTAILDSLASIHFYGSCSQVKPPHLNFLFLPTYTSFILILYFAKPKSLRNELNVAARCGKCGIK